MKRGEIFVNIVQTMALVALALVLFFPAIIASSLNLRELWGLGGLSVAGDFSFVSWLRILLSGGDAGSLSTLCSNYLRSLAFFSLLALLVVPGEWPRHLNRLYLGSAVFLTLGLLSVYFGCAPYDGIMSWGNCAGIVCVFVSASTLAYRANNGSLFSKTIVAFEIAALICMVWAWVMYVGSVEETPVMYGNFYNQNMLSGWLILILPCALLELAADKEGDGQRWRSWLSMAVLAAIAVTLYFGYNRTAWAVGAFVSLLAIGLDGQVGWKNAGIMATISGVIVIALVGAAVLGVQGRWLGAGISAVVAFLALGTLIRKASWWRQRGVIGRLALVVVLGLALAFLIGSSQRTGATYATERLQTLSSGNDSSGLARLEFYRCAWEMSLDHPLLGVGPQGFARIYPHYQKDLLWFSRHTHSTVLDILCEYGFINALLFLVLIFGSLQLGVRSCLESASGAGRRRLGVLLGCLGLFLHSSGDVDLFFTTLPMSAALLAGVLLGTPTRLRDGADLGGDVPRGMLSIRPALWRQYGLAVLVALALMLNVRCTVGEYYGTCARFFREHEQMALAVDYYRSATAAMPFNSEYQVRLVQSVLDGRLLETNDTAQHKKIGVEIDEHSLMAVYCDPQRALCHTVRGQALEALGRWEEALGCYQTALDLDHTTSPGAFFDNSVDFQA